MKRKSVLNKINRICKKFQENTLFLKENFEKDDFKNIICSTKKILNLIDNDNIPDFMEWDGSGIWFFWDYERHKVEAIIIESYLFLKKYDSKYQVHGSLLIKDDDCLSTKASDKEIKQRLEKYFNGITIEEKIETDFSKILRDPRFEYGAHLENKYDFEVKRFIVEMYEKLTGNT